MNYIELNNKPINLDDVAGLHVDGDIEKVKLNDNYTLLDYPKLPPETVHFVVFNIDFKNGTHRQILVTDYGKILLAKSTLDEYFKGVTPEIIIDVDAMNKWRGKR